MYKNIKTNQLNKNFKCINGEEIILCLTKQFDKFYLYVTLQGKYIRCENSNIILENKKILDEQWYLNKDVHEGPLNKSDIVKNITADVSLDTVMQIMHSDNVYILNS